MPGQPVANLLLLTWTSGVLDALCYMRASVFTANMTGNTVILGLALVGTGRSRVFDSALAIFSFTIGALIAATLLLRLRNPDPDHELRAGTTLELPFAILFTVLWAVFPGNGPAWAVSSMIASAACALGIQSVAARRLKISGVVTTFITGTITTAVVSLVERNQSGTGTQQEAATPPPLLAGMLLLYVIAAMSGAAVTAAKRPLAPLVVLAPAAVVWIRSFKHSSIT